MSADRLLVNAASTDGEGYMSMPEDGSAAALGGEALAPPVSDESLINAPPGAWRGGGNKSTTHASRSPSSPSAYPIIPPPPSR